MPMHSPFKASAAKVLHRWNSGVSQSSSTGIASTGSSRAESEEQQLLGLRDFELEEYEDDTPLVPPPTADYGDMSYGVPLGPLRFIEANWFQLLVGSAILVNVSNVVAEEIDEQLQQEFWLLDQFFLSFYCVELLLRLGHFKMRFFAASWDEPWNYLDLVIVVLGVLDQWVLPAMNAGGQSAFFRLVRALRLFRLLRVVRLFRVWLTADFSWTESGWFQSLVGTVIALNAVIIGFETDIESPAWWWIEQGLLVFFVFELMFRLRLQHCNFFTDPEDCWWNMLDFLIVISGVFDQWVMQIWYIFVPQTGNGTDLGQMMLLMRMLRLMRILRLVRVIRSVRPLYNLALGITRAMQMMVWVLVLMFLALYMLAILLTRLVGDGISIDRELLPPDTIKLFGSVLDSMFTLFAIMNGQEWSRIMPLIEQAPWTRPVLVIFTIYCSWALLSVMTGVVSDHMEEVRKSLEQQDEEVREERRELMQTALSQVFAAADKDGSGTLHRAEYMRIMASPFHLSRLQQGMGHPVSAFEFMFDWLDVDGDGQVSFKEMSEALDWLSETVTGRQLMKIYQSLKMSQRDVLKSVSSAREARQSLLCCHIAQHADLMRTMDDALGLTEAEVARSRTPFRLDRVPSASSSGLSTPTYPGERARHALKRGGTESSTFSAHTPSGNQGGGGFHRPSLDRGVSVHSMASSGSHQPRGILKHTT